jgi:hypothetical protein
LLAGGDKSSQAKPKAQAAYITPAIDLTAHFQE